MEKTFKLVFSAAGGVAGWLLGGPDGLLYALLALVAIDYILGVSSAAKVGALSSKIGFVGIARKTAIFMIIATANLVDTLVLHMGAALRTATIMYYLYNEGISILENAGKLGVKYPEKLRKALQQLGGNDG